MTAPFINSTRCLNQNNHIDENPRGYVKAVKACDCKKKMPENPRGGVKHFTGMVVMQLPWMRQRHASVNQMRPFPRLTSQKYQSSNYCKPEPKNYSFFVSLLTFLHRANHCN